MPMLLWENRTPMMAPGCLEHLKSLKEFFVAPPRKLRFASLYRKLFIHSCDLLICPEARAIEIGCGMGELLNGPKRPEKQAATFRLNRSRAGKRDFDISICAPGPERVPRSVTALFDSCKDYLSNAYSNAALLKAGFRARIDMGELGSSATVKVAMRYNG